MTSFFPHIYSDIADSSNSKKSEKTMKNIERATYFK